MYPGTHAETTPDKAAVVCASDGRVLTYRELDDRSARFARVLYDLGLRRGDVIAILSDNSPEVFEVYWAAMRSGLYVTAINWHLVAPEAAYIVDDCDARVVIASSGVRELAESLTELTPAVEHRFVFGGHAAGHKSYEYALQTAGPRLPNQPRGSDMLYSSGTTGRPKGIKPDLSTRSVDEPGDLLVASLASAFAVTPSDVYLTSAPIYHTAPLRWCAGMHALGSTVVMMDKFDAEETLRAIDHWKVTVAQFVPTMFVRMLKLPAAIQTKYDTSSLRLVVHAAAPCPPEVKRQVIDWFGPIVVEYYGSTEGNGMTAIGTEEWLSKPGSVGRPINGPVHICDDAGIEQPAGEPGLIYMETPSIPFRYHKDPEKTAASQHPDHQNWTTSGDLGYLDADGYLFVTGRKGFTIISGGVNIYPQEIEDALALHPAIMDVAVIGVPHPDMGQEVKAVVELNQSYAPSDELAQDIIDYARERVSRFKAPKSVDFTAALPRAATGKLLKREVEARYNP